MSRRGVASALTLGLCLAACTTANPGARGGPTSTAPSGSTLPSVEPSGAFVRTCDSSVFGKLGQAVLQESIVAGPVVFVASRDYRAIPANTFRVPQGKAPQIKVLLVVHGNDPVTVSVHGKAALDYNPSRWGSGHPLPLDRGQRSVVFEPCGGGPQRTQFNGGFLLLHPMCVPVTVTTADGNRSTVTLSFGVGRCA